ncbi:lectin MOA-related protein [bacterium]|nr:lectin MOA-related protein [bacterium]
MADELIRRWHQPNEVTRFKKQYISNDDLRALVADQLRGKFDQSFQLYLADGEYYCPPLTDAQSIINLSAVDRHTWIRDRFDCDDFALVLKSHFAEASYSDGQRRSSHCFGIVWGMLPGPHAINWMINDDLKLRFIEPQSDQVFFPRQGDKNIWFMLC